MPTTANGLPYPASTDKVADGAAAIQALAAAVDSKLLPFADSGWVTLDAPSGFDTSTGVIYRKLGRHVDLYVRLTKSGTASAAGVDVTLGTLPAGVRPSASLRIPVLVGTSVVLCIIGTDGIITGYNMTIPANALLSGHASYVV